MIQQKKIITDLHKQKKNHYSFAIADERMQRIEGLAKTRFSSFTRESHHNRIFRQPKELRCQKDYSKNEIC